MKVFVAAVLLFICVEIFATPIHSYRILNGDRLGNISQNWLFTAKLKIYRQLDNEYHFLSTCTGSFVTWQSRKYIVTAASWCFIQPNIDVVQLSLIRWPKYIVFLGNVEIWYGSKRRSSQSVFTISSTQDRPLIFLHQDFPFDYHYEPYIATRDFAIIRIEDTCVTGLGLLASTPNTVVHHVPTFMDLYGHTIPSDGDLCDISGWGSTRAALLYDPPSENPETEFLADGKFTAISQHACQLILPIMQQCLQLPFLGHTFCIRGNYSTNRREVMLSSSDTGTGVVCRIGQFGINFFAGIAVRPFTGRAPNSYANMQITVVNPIGNVLAHLQAVEETAILSVPSMEQQRMC